MCIFSLFAFATRALYLFWLIFCCALFVFCFFFAFCLLSAKQTTWLRFVVLLAVVIVVLVASPMMAVSVPNKRALAHTHSHTRRHTCSVLWMNSTPFRRRLPQIYEFRFHLLRSPALPVTEILSLWAVLSVSLPLASLLRICSYGHDRFVSVWLHKSNPAIR